MAAKEGENLLIIDTDVGSDDAMALLLVLNHPNQKILAITTVFGNIQVETATTNALRILNLCKRPDIPVYKGCKNSLVYPTESDDYHGPDGLGGNSHLFPLPDNVTVKDEHAANALVRLIKEHPKQITIICLGPLTNLALAHRLDPEFSDNIKGMMIMGGNILGKGNVTPCAEFNFLSDPEAAEIVLREFQTELEITPWETCVHHLSPWDWFDAWVAADTDKAKFASCVTQTAVHYCRNVAKREGYNCCDLLAMTAKLHPEVVKKRDRRHIQVETHGRAARGMMIVEWRDHVHSMQNADIILEMDMEAVTEIWDKMLL